MKKIYSLKNLDCAVCAKGLEDELNKTEGVNNAQIDFMSMKLRVNYEDKEEVVLPKLKKIAKNFEEVEIVEQLKNDDIETVNNKQLIFLVIISIISVILLNIVPIKNILKNILYVAIYLIVSSNILFRSIKNIIHGKIFDENFLMSVASIGAIILGEYFEAVAVMIFYQIGEIFQSVAITKSRKSIKGLLDLKIEKATIKTINGEKVVLPAEIKVDDILIVKAGEKIAVDGILISENAVLDKKTLTGESLPVNIFKGEEVLSGSINLSNKIEIKTIKEYKDSEISLILDMVENSESRKSNKENFISRFAKIYTPIVCVFALILAVIFPIFDGMDFNKWIYRALIFLMVSCPCALVISVPLSFFSGLGIVSKNGILVKGGNVLENIAKANIVVFDKTGTITDGEFYVEKIDSKDEEMFINYIVATQKNSNHPIAKAICREYKSNLIAENSEEIVGKGIISYINNKRVICGNEKLMSEQNIIYKKADAYGTIVYLAVDNAFLGYIIISDRIKKDVKEALTALKNLGIKKEIMLTGDNEYSAKKIVDDLNKNLDLNENLNKNLDENLNKNLDLNENLNKNLDENLNKNLDENLNKNLDENLNEYLNIDEYYSSLLPQDKKNKVEQLLNKDNTVIFVGDGINDAPVLKIADVGISMGKIGSDIAIDASDAVIMNDNIYKLCDLIKYSRRTVKIVKQNIALALIVKIGVMILGLFGLTNIIFAIIADVGVMLLVVLNALRNFKKISK